MKAKITSDKKTLVVVLSIVVIIFVAVAIGLVTYLIKTSSFVKVDATITGIDIKYGQSANEYQNRNKYVNYSFTYNNEKVDAQKLALFAFSNQVGKEVAIKVNPKNPTEIYNSLFVTIYIAVIVLCIFLGFILIKQLLSGKID